MHHQWYNAQTTLSMQQLPQPSLKACVPHPPTTTPKSALKPKSAEVKATPLNSSGPGYQCLEASLPQLL